MGQALQTPVTSTVTKREVHSAFRVGLAEMNGWRASMEDAHIIHMRDDWGFFGVFDGHGGDACSAFIAKRLTEELVEHGEPEDNAVMRQHCFRLDTEFLESGQPSGSTGTFVIIKPPAEAGGKYLLRVGNIGDSRVLLGRADGTIVAGEGTDSGLTTDHKPDYASERERIERCGGHVAFTNGVARVNGDLAVSRAFGDGEYKKTGGPAQEDHPVSVDPEFFTAECDATDFVMLVCDGISEGDFPNPEVIKLAADKLKSTGDPAAASVEVCFEAIKCGSKDNLSCMIVLLGGGEFSGLSLDNPAKMELLPGPFAAPQHANFKKAYTAMATHAGKNCPASMELRYNAVQDRLEAVTRDEAEAGPAPVWMPKTTDELRTELAKFGDGPPEALARGSDERTAWFSEWLDEEERKGEANSGGAGGLGGLGAGGLNGLTQQQLFELVQQNPRVLNAISGGQGAAGAAPGQQERMAHVASTDALRPLIESHPALKWDDRFAELGGTKVVVQQDDESDGTSQIRSSVGRGFSAWLPTAALRDYIVRVAPVDVLGPAIEEHPGLRWEERRLEMCGKEGTVLQIDNHDDTGKVSFPAPLSCSAWFPLATLAEVEPPAGEEAE